MTRLEFEHMNTVTISHGLIAMRGYICCHCGRDTVDDACIHPGNGWNRKNVEFIDISIC